MDTDPVIPASLAGRKSSMGHFLGHQNIIIEIYEGKKVIESKLRQVGQHLHRLSG